MTLHLFSLVQNSKEATLVLLIFFSCLRAFNNMVEIGRSPEFDHLDFFFEAISSCKFEITDPFIP